MTSSWVKQTVGIADSMGECSDAAGGVMVVGATVHFG